MEAGLPCSFSMTTNLMYLHFLEISIRTPSVKSYTFAIDSKLSRLSDVKIYNIRMLFDSLGCM